MTFMSLAVVSMFGNSFLKIAVEEAGMQDLRIRRQKRRNLGAILARKQLGEEDLVGLCLGHQNLHGADEIAPGVLAPGVVLLDARDAHGVRAGVGQHQRASAR